MTFSHWLVDWGVCLRSPEIHMIWSSGRWRESTAASWNPWPPLGVTSHVAPWGWPSAWGHVGVAMGSLVAPQDMMEKRVILPTDLGRTWYFFRGCAKDDWNIFDQIVSNFESWLVKIQIPWFTDVDICGVPKIGGPQDTKRLVGCIVGIPPLCKH